MFKRKPDIKSFGARDIQRYIDGGMSPAERNELERAALRDPLLEEALEGYASLLPGNEAAVQEDLSAIRSRLGGRVGQTGGKRAVSRTWMRAAAVLVILAGAGILLYSRRQPDKTNRRRDLAERASAAQASPETPAVPPPAAISPNSIPAKATVLSPNIIPPNTVAISPGIAARMSKPTKSKRAASANNRQAAPAGIAGKTAPGPPFQADNAGSTRLQSSLAAIPVSPYNRRDTIFDKIPHPVQYQNKVTDPYNQPIAGATVRLLPSGPTTITDGNGYFTFGAGSVAADSAAAVLIEAVGYTPRRYPVNQLEQLPAIQLKENTNSLDDVGVTGYGVQKKKPETRKMSVTYHAIDDSSEAQPINGWSAFNLYISHNMSVPGEALNKDIHGDVILSFGVNREGKPVSISVDKSLCIPCDAEAIRLLKEGPQWDKGKKKRAKGRVKVRF